MAEVKCMNPWDPQSKRQYQIDGVYCALNAGQSQGGQAHGVCYRKTAHPINSAQGQGYEVTDVSDTLNVFDNSESRTPILICYAIDQQGGKSNCGYAENVMMTLCSDSHGTPHALCYAVEGNVVDRTSSKNGKGWCENVSPTLNTQDRHAICFQLCRDRDDPSVSVSDTAYCIPANPMSDRGQAVCYETKDI